MTRKHKGNDAPNAAGASNATLKKLRSRDRVGVAGDLLAVFIGMLAGVLGAGSIAAVLGISTLWGSTRLAGWLGGVFVTKTPMGWFIGAAVIGGVVGYVIARLVRSGAWHDKIADDIADRVEAKEKAARTETAEAPSTSGRVDAELSSAIEQAMARGLLSEMDRQRLLELTTSGTLSVQVALERVRALLSESTEEHAPEASVDSTETREAAIRQSVSKVTQAGIGFARSGAETLAEETRHFMGEARGKVEGGLSSAGRFLKNKIVEARRGEERKK